MPASNKLQDMINRIKKSKTQRQKTLRQRSSAKPNHDYNELESRHLLAGLNTMVGTISNTAVQGNAGVIDVFLDNESLTGTRDTTHEIFFDYGVSGDTFVAGDLSGLGFDQIIATRNNGGALQWLGDTDRDTNQEYLFRFGLAGDIPLVADFNGDGYDDVAAVRASGGFLDWYLHYGVGGGSSLPTDDSTVSVDASFTFGLDTDTPLAGDFNGDDRADVAAVRAPGFGPNFDWYIHHADAGANPYPVHPGTGAGQSIDITYSFGDKTDIPVVGDWDNDGDDNLGVVDEGAGVGGTSKWRVDTNNDATEDFNFDYGLTGYQYLTGVWADHQWDGNDSLDWSVATNWSKIGEAASQADSVPLAGSTVVIDQPGSIDTITFAGLTSSIGSVNSNKNIIVDSGSLTLQDESSTSGMEVAGGVLQVNTLLDTPSFELTGGTFNNAGTGVLGSTTIDVSASNSRIRSAGGSFILSNPINMSGFGNLYIGGADNTELSGAVTGAGTLFIDSPSNVSISGALSPLSVALVQGTLSYQGSGSLTSPMMVSAGQLQIGTNSMGTGAITFAGGTVTALGGTRTLNNPISVQDDFTISMFSGLNFAAPVTLSGGDRSIEVTGSAQAAMFSGGITDDGSSRSLTFSGTGNARLTVNGSDYGGDTTISNGSLTTAIANALPTGTALTISGGSTFDMLDLDQVVGSLSGDGTIKNDNATLTAGGNNQSTIFSGTIEDGSSNNGEFVKLGTGSLTMSGFGDFNGGVTIGGGELIVGAQNGIPSGSPVQIEPGAQLSIGGFNQITGSISGAGTIDVVTSGNLIVGQTIDSTLSSVLTGDGTFTKSGSSELVYTGSSPAYTGDIIVDGGILVLNGSIGSGAPGQTLGVGGGLTRTLKGSGSFDGKVRVQGTFAPGNSPGIFSTGDFELTATGTLESELGGSGLNPGVDYDQVDVTGTVTLAGSLDTILYSNITSTVDEFVIINNDGADSVIGTFVGLAEGATIVDGPISYTVSYVGGDGNDVTLTALNTTNVSVWTGEGDGTTWEDTLNWSGGSLPVAADDVVIDGSGTISVSTSQTINSLDTNHHIEIIGGTLSLGANSQFNDGITIDDNGIVNGTLSSTSAVTLDETSAWDNATINVASLINVGTLNIGGTADFDGTLDNNGTVNQTGSISIASSTINNNGTYNIAEGDIFQIGSSDFNNSGTLEVTAGSVEIEISLNNTGTVEASGGGFSLSDVDQESTGLLTGGTWRLSGGEITLQNAISEIQGTAAVHMIGINQGENDGTFFSTVSDLYVNGSASLFLESSANVTFNGDLEILANGTLDIDSTSSLAVGVGGGPATLTHTAGNVVVDGALNVGVATGFYQQTGGTLSGTGIVAANSFFSGTVSPAGSVTAGLLTFTRATTQLQASATTELQISGTGAGQFDELAGGLTLGGNVLLDLINGYSTSGGETFVLVENVTGSFANVSEGQVISVGGSVFQATYLGGSGDDFQLSALSASTYTVSNLSDSGPGSFRQAILDANANAGLRDTIEFGVAGTITPLTQLPTINDAVVINGYSAPGATPNSQLVGSNAVITITIDGSSLGASAFGFNVSADDVEIRGISMIGFGNGGILDGTMITVGTTVENFTLAGSHIGVDAAGTTPNGSRWGLVLRGSGHTIGGSSLADRNVISGNDSAIFALEVTNTTIAGNYIGVDASGTADLGNGSPGIWVEGISNNITIGGLTDPERNVISGNNGDGIRLLGATVDDVTIAGNYIGADANGTTAIVNDGNGILIEQGANDITIGGTTVASGNVISGNTQVGVLISNSSNNIVSGNLIGTNESGTGAIANGTQGVFVSNGSTGNVIGGSSVAARNVVSGNVAEGVLIADSGSDGNFVQGNYIGVTINGDTALGNGGAGVGIDAGATGNTIGVDGNGSGDAFEGNVISGNQEGILVQDSGTNLNIFAGNYIGTNAAGNAAVPNGSHGIHIVNGGESNIIGGSTVATRNVISGNTENGIRIENSNNNSISGNIIGLDASGTSALGNVGGVRIRLSSISTDIGSLAGNVVSGNTGTGISIESGSNSTIVRNNFVGTDVTGVTYVAGQGAGISVTDSANNVIGGTSVQGNVIANNSVFGVKLVGLAATGNAVSGNDINDNGAVGVGILLETGANGNFIGVTDGGFDGNSIQGNGNFGIQLFGVGTSNNRVAGNLIGNVSASGIGIYFNGGASNNLIGTNSDGFGDANERNIISNNLQAGVRLDGATTINNVIAGNYIGLDELGASLGNGQQGIRIIGANNNVIGGSTVAAGNVISSNASHGIFVQNASGNQIAGNLIGTGPGGIADLGNGGRGISLDNASNNIFGGETVGHRNVIAGNTDTAITFSNSSNDNSVFGNFLSVDSTGGTLLANAWSVSIANSSGNRIGGGQSGQGNIIGQRILITGSNQPNTFNNKVQGNLIGIGVSGASLGYAGSGVVLESQASQNIIGTDSDNVNDATEGNTIAGLGSVGVVIRFAGTDQNVVAGNLIGTDSSNSTVLGNTLAGILIQDGAEGNIIGGTTDNARNIISGNTNQGIWITNSDNNHVQGNYIGLDATGTNHLPNLGSPSGILIENGSSGNVIGGGQAGSGNVVVGHFTTTGHPAIWIRDAGSDNNVISGNFINTDATGMTAISAGQPIFVDSGVIGTRIGTTNGNANERNVIAGVGQGVVISGTDTFVAGNYIGTNVDGEALTVGGSLSYGIRILPPAVGTIVGGLTYGMGNVISGATSYGLIIEATSGIPTQILGNYIGITGDGQNALGNGDRGIWIQGDDVIVHRNTISSNVAGVRIDGENNYLAGNFVGTSPTGTLHPSDNPLTPAAGTTFGNTSFGVEILGDNNVIGRLPSGTIEGNVISGNNGDHNLADRGNGIQISGDNNFVVGNKIGTDGTGTQRLRNIHNGIYITGAGNQVGTNGDGTSDVQERNIISGNYFGEGIYISTVTAIGNSIAGNFIGLDVTGTIGLSSGGSGIIVDDQASGTMIGGSKIADRNVISGNHAYGIRFVQSGTGNKVQGNYIGTDAGGTFAIGNAITATASGAGVGINSVGSNVVIIGTDGDGANDATEGNVISGSFRHGVRIQGTVAATAAHVIAGNLIGTDWTGKIAVPNQGDAIQVINADNVQIGTDGDGTSDELEGNVISGNRNLGTGPGTAASNAILVSDTNLGDSNTVENTIIAGNLIGTDVDGLYALANESHGILIRDTINTTIGGSAIDQRNVVSGNEAAGIRVVGTTTSGLLTQGNRVGTNGAGSAAIGNLVGGINIDDAAGVEIFDNLISGNLLGEVVLFGADGAKVQNNLIGVDASGTVNIAGNSASPGIGDVALTVRAANDVVIGTDGNGINDANEGNIIVASAIDSFDFAISVGNSSSNTRISGNKIQVDNSGTTSLGYSNGINLSSAVGTLIGTDGDGVSDELEGNHIAPRLAAGVNVNASTNTVIAGNLLGVSADQTSILSELRSFGVFVAGNSSDTRIGTDGNGSGDGLEANVIGGFRHGIRIDDSSLTTIKGNFVGVGSDGVTPLGNEQNGIFILGNPSVSIGDPIPVLENTIAFNGFYGVSIASATSNAIDFFNSQIFGNLAGPIDVAGDFATTPNDAGDSDGFLNFPVITSSAIEGGLLTIEGFARPGVGLNFVLSDPMASGFGQGKTGIGSVTEGGVADLDATTGTYTSADANGLNVGTDTTNRFRFVFNVGTTVGFSDMVTAFATESGMRISEYSNARFVSNPTNDGPGSSLPPVIPPVPNFTIISGERLQQAVIFEDFDSTSWTAQVNFGDGTIQSVPVVGRTVQLDHLYPGSGAYAGSITITDNSNQSTTAAFTTNVANEAPDVDFNLFSITSPVNEGSPVTLTGQFNDSGALDNHTVLIEWGDGAIDTIVVNIGDRDFSESHVYLDDSNPAGSVSAVDVYRVAVSVVDQGGLNDATPIGLLLAEIQNVLPSDLNVNLSNTTAFEGDTVTLDGSFVDPGVLDTHIVRVDWGDGSSPDAINLAPGITLFSGLNHTYVDDQAVGVDQYEISVEVIDDDQPLEPVSVKRTIAIVNEVPAIMGLSLGTFATINENGFVTLTGAFSDAGIDDRHRVEINWGDNSSPTTVRLNNGLTSFSQDHIYLDDPAVGSDFTITVKVTDNDTPDGVFGNGTIDVTVNNVNPLVGPITILDADGTVTTGPVNEGDTVTLTGSLTDVGSLDTHTVSIIWGDGSVGTNAAVDSTNRTFTATHTFINDGTGPLDRASINVIVTDDDGGSQTTLQQLIVDNVLPTVNVIPDGTNSDPNLIAFKSDVFDPSSVDAANLTYTWEAWSGAATGAPLQTASSTNFLLDRTADLNGIYTVKLTVTDNVGSASFEAAILVGTNAADTMVITDSDFAAGQSNLIVLALGDQDIVDGSSVSAGNNLIIDGGNETDQLFGGAGDDVFYLHNGDDSANVSASAGGIVTPIQLGNFEGGNDRYVLTPNSILTVVDTQGDNALDFGPATFGISFDQNVLDGTAQNVDPLGLTTGNHQVSALGSFSELVGSSFDDVLTAAEGGTVNAGGGDDMLKIANLSLGTTTNISGDDGADTLQNSGLTAGKINFSGDSGADLFENMGTIQDIEFSGGADNDVFMNAASGTINGMIEFTGGADNDKFENAGTLTSIIFSGGADNDIFINSGDALGTINFGGDEGVDTFENSGSATSIVFSGGADNDIFNNSSVATGSINFGGDDGVDTFNNNGTVSGMLVFSGGADNDVFNNNSLGSNMIDFSGDAGVDTFNNVGTATQIDFNGGTDNDVFNNSSTMPGNINFGGDAGADVFNNNGLAGTIIFTGGADGDEFNNLGVSTANITFNGGADNDAFTNMGTAGSIIFSGGADDDAFNNVGVNSGMIDFNGDTGADTLTNIGTITDIDFSGRRW